MIINASGVSTLTSYPFIGYDNVVTATNVSASTSDTSYPASNVANPALNLKWQGSSAADQYLTVTLSNRSVSYVAIAGHNFYSQNIAASLTAYGYPDAYTKILLHLDTDFTDEAGHTFTAVGNAAITTTKSHFGRGSLFCDGAGDWIGAPDSVDFTLGSSEFTIECWFNLNTAIGAHKTIAAQGSVSFTTATSSWAILVVSTGVVRVHWCVGGVQKLFDSTSVYSDTINSGWHHVAFVRSGNTFTLYVDGVVEGTPVTSADTINDVSADVRIGALDSAGSLPFSGYIDEFRMSVGVARYTAAFTPPTSPHHAQMADAYTPPASTDKAMLHFDGPNNSTTFRDEVGNTWTAHGTAKIDGTEDAGAFLDGASYIDTPDSSSFALGSGDFTIEMWVKFTNDPITCYFSGQCDVTGGGSANSSFYFFRYGPTGIMAAYVVQGTTPTGPASTTAVNIAKGWTHVALVRSGNLLKLFIDGTQEGTAGFSGSINDSAAKLGVGSLGDFVGNPMVGYIDEFRFSNTARYTANFTPTPRASTTRIPPDDGPLVFRFPSTLVSRVRLVMRQGDAAPQVAVMYAGTLLEMERSIDVNVTHTPINMGRQSRIASGKAENGKFIGRIVLGEWNAGSIDFKWFTPTWYRANFDPFLNSAVENPFFIAWNPIEYPLEVGYVALTEDAKPEVDTVTKRVHVKLDFQGESA